MRTVGVNETALIPAWIESRPSTAAIISEHPIDREGASPQLAATAAFVAFVAAASSAVAMEPQFAWVALIGNSHTQVSPSKEACRDYPGIALFNFQYERLFEAVRTLAHLDSQDAHFIDDTTARQSLELLTFLEGFGVPAPRLFPHGGDTLVLEWPIGPVTRYVTYADETVRLRDRGLGAEYLSPALFNLRVSNDVTRLITALGGNLWRSKQLSQSI